MKATSTRTDSWNSWRRDAMILLSACALAACAAPGNRSAPTQAAAPASASRALLPMLVPIRPGTLQVNPSVADFGTMPYGSANVQTVIVATSGPGAAELTAVRVADDMPIKIDILGQVASPGHPAVFSPPKMIEPGTPVAMNVVVEARKAGDVAASIELDGATAAAPVTMVVKAHTTLDRVVAVPDALEGTFISLVKDGPVDVHLTAAASASPDAAIAGYHWTLAVPDGGAAQMLPNASVATPTLRVERPGTYALTLTVVDAKGQMSAASMPLRVSVVDRSAISAVVRWSTEGGAGTTAADLDMHLVDANGTLGGMDVNGDGHPDGWFDPANDCWQGNQQPVWSTDNPLTVTAPVSSTDHKTWDGVMLPIAHQRGFYKVGVYAQSVPLGATASARVEIRIAGKVVWTSAPVSLVQGDFWAVGEINFARQAFAAFGTPSGQHVVARIKAP